MKIDWKGELIGNLNGNVVGNLNGNVIGNLNGNVVGNLTGDVIGNLTGDVTGDVNSNNINTKDLNVSDKIILGDTELKAIKCDKQACFIPNGDNNYLQSLINNGGLVELEDGIYDQTIEITKSVTIKAKNTKGSATKCTLSPSVIFTQGILFKDTGSNYSNVIIDGIEVRGSSNTNKTIYFESGNDKSNITIQNSIINGESVNGREALNGNRVLGGHFTIQNCIFKDYIGHWFFFDNTSSSGTTQAHLVSFTFDSNYVTNCSGSAAIRGLDISGNRLETATITNNIMKYNGNINNKFWAAIEINSCNKVIINNNIIKGITNTISNGWDGINGQVIQIWSKDPWEVEIQNNDFSENYQGIIIAASGPFYVPTGQINNNNLSCIKGVALSLQWPPENSTNPSPINNVNEYYNATLTGGIYDPQNPDTVLNAAYNYWGNSNIFAGGAINISNGTEFSKIDFYPKNVLSTTTLIDNIPILGTNKNIPNSLVKRDSSGSFISNNTTVNGLLESNDTTINGLLKITSIPICESDTDAGTNHGVIQGQIWKKIDANGDIYLMIKS